MADMTDNVSSNMNKGAALLASVIASFLTAFMGSSVNIALPSIAKYFNLDAVMLSWVSTSFILASAVFLVPFGRIADIYGRKRIFLYGIVIYTVSSLISAIAPSAMLLILFRVVQGIGSAMIFGNGVAILTSVFPSGERGRVLGISVAATYAGLSLGFPLGGFLTEHFGWRSIFFITVPLGLIGIAAVLWKLKGEWAEARGENFDSIGSTIYGLALVAIILGFSLLPAMLGVWLVAIGVLGMSVFIAWEMRIKNPVLNVRLFSNNPVFTFSNLATLINYGAIFSVGFLVSLYLQYIKGLSPEHAGLILVSEYLVMAILSPIAGRISDRIEPRLLASAGMALTTIGLILTVFLGQDSGIGSVLVILAIVGIGIAFFSSPNTNAVMSSIEQKFYGVASGTLGTMRLVGQVLSMGITMMLFSLYIGRVQITPEYYPLFLRSFKTAFVIFSVLSCGAIFASLARGKVR